MNKFKIGDLVTPKIECMLSGKALRVTAIDQENKHWSILVEVHGLSRLFQQEDLRHITTEEIEAGLNQANKPDVAQITEQYEAQCKEMLEEINCLSALVTELDNKLKQVTESSVDVIKQKPIQRNDIVLWKGNLHLVAGYDRTRDNEWWLYSLTSYAIDDYAPEKELIRVGSFRKKVKQLRIKLEVKDEQP